MTDERITELARDCGNFTHVVLAVLNDFGWKLDTVKYDWTKTAPKGVGLLSSVKISGDALTQLMLRGPGELESVFDSWGFASEAQAIRCIWEQVPVLVKLGRSG